MRKSPTLGLLLILVLGFMPATAPGQVSVNAAAGNPVAKPDVSVPVANLLGSALALYRKGDFDGAIADYQGFLKDHPGSPDAYAGIVRAHLKKKDVDGAAQAAEDGIAHTTHPRMRTARAEVWFRQGKLVEAEKEWVDVINSGYPEPRAYLGLARMRQAIAMYKSAKGFLDKAHDFDPNDPDIQEEWIDTLSRAERVKYLQSRLAGDNNWDADERADVADYLKYLQERAKQKNASPCRMVSKVTSTETPMVRLLQDPVHLRGYGLAVSLNGHKSSLMIDTGSSGILVKRSIAEHAGVSRISESAVSGIGKKGRRHAYIGIVNSIKIGQLEFQNCPIEVMDSRSVVGDDGLIGTDVFEDFLVELDFPKEKVRLSQLPPRPGEAATTPALKNGEDESDDDSGEDSSAGKPASGPATDAKPTEAKPTDAKTAPPYFGPQDRYIAPEMLSFTHIFRFGHQLLVPTMIGKVPYKLFILDTGSLVNFISPVAAREVTKVHGDSDTIVEGISGRVDKVYSANKAVLTFGHLRQENQDITAFDTKPISDNIGTEVSGFLGFAMLHILDIKIDYRDALVDFKYDAGQRNR